MNSPYILSKPILFRLFVFKSRRMTVGCFWLLAALAIAAFISQVWLLGGLFLVTALLCRESIKWVDENGEWAADLKKSDVIIIYGIIGIFLIVAIFRIFFVDLYHIPQNGMYPNLPRNSFLLLNKSAYTNISDIKRGDIIVFQRFENGQSYNYIWRVIALPGETVDASGEALAINGQPVQRDLISNIAGQEIVQEKIGDVSYEVDFDQTLRTRPPDISITVPPNHVYVMGDNRFDARDSRYFGPVPFDTIVGKKFD